MPFFAVVSVKRFLKNGKIIIREQWKNLSEEERFNDELVLGRM